MSEAKKPARCPFCGDTDTRNHGDASMLTYWVECSGCGARGDVVFDNEEDPSPATCAQSARITWAAVSAKVYR